MLSQSMSYDQSLSDISKSEDISQATYEEMSKAELIQIIKQQKSQLTDFKEKMKMHGDIDG